MEFRRRISGSDRTPEDRGVAFVRDEQVLAEIDEAFREVERGEQGAAEERLLAALAMHRKAGDKKREAITLGCLGTLRHLQGRRKAAVCCHEEARSLLRPLNDPQCEGRASCHLGAALADRQDVYGAGQALDAARGLLQYAGDAQGLEMVAICEGLLMAARAREAELRRPPDEAEAQAQREAAWGRLGSSTCAESRIYQRLLAEALAPPRFVAVPPSAPRDVPRWNIDSTPPGAAIWFNGHDTGLRTPAVLHGGRAGRYQLRLVLAGHADNQGELPMKEGDLDWSLHFGMQSVEAAARQEATPEEARRPPDEAGRERTRAFLGDEADWSRVCIEFKRGGSFGLDAATITLWGDGRALVAVGSSFGPGGRHEVTLTKAEVRRVLEVFIDQAYCSIVVADRRGVPDEIRLEIRMTGATGTVHEVSLWGGDEHPRFHAVYVQAEAVLIKLPGRVRKKLKI